MKYLLISAIAFAGCAVHATPPKRRVESKQNKHRRVRAQTMLAQSELAVVQENGESIGIMFDGKLLRFKK